MTFYSKVGSFNTSSGAASNTVSGLGFTPVALIMWVGSQSATGWANQSSMFGIGFAANNNGTMQYGAVCDSLDNAAQYAPNVASGAYALYTVDAITDTAVLQASGVSFSSGQFIVSWNYHAAYTVYYFALGGSDITGVGVASWTCPTTAAPATQSVTGLGFQPTGVMHIGLVNNFGHSLGAMDNSGNQWAEGMEAIGNTTPHSTTRSQITDHCYVKNTHRALTNDKSATYTSMDSGGFTVSFDVQTDANLYLMYSLCLAGCSVKVGYKAKTGQTAAVTDTVSGLSFTPTAVLTFTDSSAASSAVQDGQRHNVGASDGTHFGTVAVTEKNVGYPSVVYNYNDATNTIVVSDNDAGTSDVVAPVNNFQSGSFDIAWGTASATTAWQVCYIAFGSSSVSSSWTQSTVPSTTSASSVPTTISASSSLTETTVPSTTSAASTPTIASSSTPAINASETQSILPKATVVQAVTPQINISESVSQAAVNAAASPPSAANISETKVITQSNVGAIAWTPTNVAEGVALTPTITATIIGYVVTPAIVIAESIGIDQLLAEVESTPSSIKAESLSIDPAHAVFPGITVSESMGVNPHTSVAATVAPRINLSESEDVDPSAALEQFVHPAIDVAESVGIDPAVGNRFWAIAYATPAINVAESLALTQITAQPGVSPSINISESLSTIATIPPPVGGTGKLWFGGVDITTAPYYAHLAYETKYWFLDGLDSMQFVTNPLSLISTRPYLKDWLISTVIRVIAPDQSRQTLLTSLIALSELFDPLNGEQQLIFNEYFGSYFMAKRQTSTLANETASPYMAEIDIDWACTGPAYSINESVVQKSVNALTTDFTIKSNGDIQASPTWRVYVGRGGQNQFRFTNKTTGETVEWGLANVAFGDLLEFIMDSEEGVPYTVLQNGNLAIATVSGPAWPHLVPGENVIEFRQSYAAPALLEVAWRDRYVVGKQVVAMPPPLPTLRPPTETLLSGKDTPGQPGSYIFSGIVEDVYFNGVPDLQVKLYVSTPESNVDTSWDLAGMATTDTNGNFTIGPTGAVDHTVDFKATFGGSLNYFPSSSTVIRATPPNIRTTPYCDIKQTGTDPNHEFYGALDTTSGHVPGATVELQITVDAGGTDHHTNYWRPAPISQPGDTAVSITDANGNFGFWRTPGPGIQYFRAYFPGDLNHNACYSSGVGTDVITLTEELQWPIEEPGPAEYWVSLSPTMIDSGRIQYFANLGFTTCVMPANQNDTTSVYAVELAIIKSLGMNPIIDIEYVVTGGEWNYGNFSIYTSWLQALVAAGWTTVACEAGWPGCIEFVYSCGFSGYVNYGINLGPLTFTWPYPTAQNPTTVEGMYIDPGTTANSWECYYDAQIGTPGQAEVEGGIEGSSLLGIPNGIIAGVWRGAGNDIYNNSIAGAVPVNNVGNTYQSIFDWSYENSWPLDFLNVFFYPWDYTMGMNYYLSLDFDVLVASLQNAYPPANTNQLIPPTVLATHLTLDWILNTDGSYSFSGVLTNLATGAPMINTNVSLLWSTDNATWSPVLQGINPQPTDSTSAFAWNNLRFTTGTYYFTVYYAGDTTHMPIYGPYEGANGVEVTIP